MILLEDAIEELSGVVAGGTCDRDTLIRYINRAQRYFHDLGEWWGSIMPACMDVCGPCIRLPNEIETIRRIKVNGIPSPVHARGFEYMQNAVTNVQDWASCHTFLIDRGESPLLCPMIPGGKIVIASTCHEPIGTMVQVRGLGMDGREIHGCCQGVGEALTFQCLREGIQTVTFSQNAYRDILAIRKQKTAGYVFVIERWDDKPDYRILAEMHPDQTTASHRVYEVAGGKGRAHHLQMLVRRRFIPTYRSTDMLYIQSLPALKKAVDFIRLDDAAASKEAYFAKKEVLELLGAAIFAKDGEEGITKEAHPASSVSLGFQHVQ